MNFDETFFVAVATLIFAIVVYKPSKKAILSLIDKRIDGIRNEIDEAKKLKEEAQEILAEAKRNLLDSEQQASDILNHAKEEAKSITKNVSDKLKKDIETRKKLSIQKIQSIEDKAVEEVKKSISAMTINAAQTIVEENLDEATYDSIIEGSVDKISKTIH